MVETFAGTMGDAVVMRQYGPPDVLRLDRVVLPALAPDDIRVRTIAAAINHSDLEIRAGSWPILRADPFPYTPGLEVVGDIVETGAAVARFGVGERVVTMMQGLGGVRARRPGGYAEYVVVAADAAAPVPADLDPIAVAALGLGAVTAFEGLRKLGPARRAAHRDHRRGFTRVARARERRFIEAAWSKASADAMLPSRPGRGPIAPDVARRV